MTDNKGDIANPNPVTTEVKAPETNVEAKVEPQKETPQINTEELETKVSEKVSEKVSKTVVERIGEALGLTKKQEEKLPENPEELRKLIEENSERKVKEILDSKAKEYQNQEEERQKQLEEGSKRFQILWKSQYDALAEAGKVPKIVNPDDPNDPGRQAKTKLLVKLSEIIRENEANNRDEVPTIKEIFYEYPEVLSEKVPGANLPVSGGGRNPSATSGYSYKEVHDSSFEDLLRN